MLNTSFDCIELLVLIDSSGSYGASLYRKNKFLPMRDREAALIGNPRL
jgi:hypothetical protein